jgi:hypothetical protein
MEKGRHKQGVDLGSKLFVDSSLDLLDRCACFMKFGGPQGLLLTEQSARAMFIDITTQETFVSEGRFIAGTITKNFVHDLWIFLCRGICFPGQTDKLERIKHGACFTPPNGK